MSNEPGAHQGPDLDPANGGSDIQPPPRTLGGILRRVGPGVVLAGSIVGSGELIATTVTGAQAGFWLLWLILVGCVIKVFVQIELGRFAIVEGRTTLVALNDVPGPRLDLQFGRRSARGNWIVWFWFLMFLASLAQLGGIVGGVGQALGLSWPLTEEGRARNRELDARLKFQATEARLALVSASERAEESRDKIASLQRDLDVLRPVVESSRERDRVHERYDETRAELARYEEIVSDEDRTETANTLRGRIRELRTELASLEKRVAEVGPRLEPWDHQYWAAIVTVITAVLLVVGRYGFIERFVMLLVGSFTVVTVGNVIALQLTDAWSVGLDDVLNGLRFEGPKLTADQKLAGLKPITMALATFGIIGVGAAELVAYPYWCIEKGYARWTGKRDAQPGWAGRAKGWLRVMHWDAWSSMIVYTIATVAFYLLGGAILHRANLHPEGQDMIRMLAVMYEPVFGPIAQWLFVFGAFAILYSTFFVANAAHTRVATDGIVALGLAKLSDASRRRTIRLFGALFPLICLAVYVPFPKPVTLVKISGVMQALMLPMLGFAALYFRYRRVDQRLKPGVVWDAMLFLSFLAFLLVGLYLAYAGLLK